jgi:heat shock protein HspQ
MKQRNAKFNIGDVVRHRMFPFRGVIFDVDPEFANTEEWWNSIPAEVRPDKDQPFYHLLAENDETEYVAYVSEQNLINDESGLPLRNPQVAQIFDQAPTGQLKPKMSFAHLAWVKPILFQREGAPNAFPFYLASEHRLPSPAQRKSPDRSGLFL